ncbi:alanine:cation symporter family protein [Jeotgalibacillus sp. S-D1]|uniref:alanine/glycine:cation symporter family protein n=1 Tax=Jeotgalibacillus sp. S-D1 TaxID=2552189 RepID=UPI0010596859|nr:alanine/glycine:cation symporter family protein [Jeotgalibacillus sp. S-D1]TDL34925.1 alanine:cation symporter family protein [Jeotgalibacillus sp. S-D1]
MEYGTLQFVARIDSIATTLNGFLWDYILIIVLIGCGLYFSVRSGFMQFTKIGDMGRLLTEKSTISAEGQRGISSFKAFTISTASRVGTGNLAGVATAIYLGGPGAVFWMWIIALVGAASAFVESTLAQVYKVKDKDGFRGGPAYYMEKGLNARWMGIIFAVIISITFGLIFNSVQSNTISLALEGSFGWDRSVVGIVLVVITGIVIFGGVNRVAAVTSVVVPVMAILYILLALFILITNLNLVPEMFTVIFSNAFGITELVSGGIGAAIMNGIKRGLFSNEAGMGSAPNAAATAGVTHPAKQGLIQTLGVFVDTLVICTATALIIIMSGEYLNGTEGIQLTQDALAFHVGDWAAAFISIAIFLFAFSSIVGNYYYGQTNIEFIKNSPLFLNLYRLIVMGMVYFGSVQSFGVVWNLADVSMATMALINLTAISLLSPLAFKVLKDYQRQKQNGLDPVFYRNSIPGLKNADCWEDGPVEK